MVQTREIFDVLLWLPLAVHSFFLVRPYNLICTGVVLTLIFAGRLRNTRDSDARLKTLLFGLTNMLLVALSYAAYGVYSKYANTWEIVQTMCVPILMTLTTATIIGSFSRRISVNSSLAIWITGVLVGLPLALTYCVMLRLATLEKLTYNEKNHFGAALSNSITSVAAILVALLSHFQLVEHPFLLDLPELLSCMGFIFPLIVYLE